MAETNPDNRCLDREILAATSIGYAVIDEGDVLVASNPAFQALAAAAGEKTADLARRLAASNRGDLERSDSGVRVVVMGSSGDRLIEMVPGRVHHSVEKQEERLDSVTGVLDRESILARVRRAVFSREDEPFALVFLDLDGFKPINDRFGHLVGDACLRAVGQRLSDAIRGADAVGRYGGDEFLLLLSGIDCPERFAPVETRLRQIMVPEFDCPEGPIRLGMSLGVAYSTAETETVDQLIARADHAMYADKRRAGPSPQ